MLVAGHFLETNFRGQSSVFIKESTQLHLILSKTTVGTFPLFTARFNVMQFSSSGFLLLLPFGDFL